METHRPLRGVLIYVNDILHDDLLNVDYIEKVTIDTSPEDLRAMDRKSNGYYPVYLVNEDYGIRGLDYRAENN